MSSSSNDPTTGAPIFDDADAPDLAVNPTEVAEFAASVGTRLIGSTADRGAYAFGREGLRWRDTTNGYEYEHNGSGWVVVAARIVGRVVRSTTPLTFPASPYSNVAANTYWTAQTAEGISAYSNGWTIPLTGRYRLSYEMRASGDFLTGLTVNYSGTSPSLIFASSPTAVQSVAAATVSGSIVLSSGDVIRPYLLAAASTTPAWVISQGFFSVEWVGTN